MSDSTVRWVPVAAQSTMPASGVPLCPRCVSMCGRGRRDGEIGTADRLLFLRGARRQLLCRFLIADVVCDHPCSAAREALGDGSPDTALLRGDQCSRRTARATGRDLTNWERCLSIGRNEAQPTRNLP